MAGTGTSRQPSSKTTATATPSPPSSQQLMDNYVKSALTQRRREPGSYTFVLQQLKTPGTLSVLSGWLQALAKSAADISPTESRELLSVVFRTDFSVDQAVQSAFFELVLDLATSHSTYVPQMLRALLPHIHPKRVAPGGPYDSERTERVRGGVVSVIREMIRLVPLSSSVVCQTFVDMYPHRRYDTVSQLCWLDSALEVVESAPVLREPIYGVIVNRLLQLDAEIKYDELDADEEMLSRLDLSEGGGPSASENAEAAGKLDSMMDRLFNFFTRRSAGESEEALLRQDFEVFMDLFFRAVLPTYHSKFVQFIMFFLCKFKPEEMPAAFMTELLRRIRDENETHVVRLTSSLYFASFLSRANYVPPDVSCHFLRELIDHARTVNRTFINKRSSSTSMCTGRSSPHKRQSERSGSPPPATATQQELFNTLVQSVMYAIIYAHNSGRIGAMVKALGKEEQEVQEWVLGVEELVMSPLAPLRFCNQTVVSEFMKVWAAVRPNGRAFDRLLQGGSCSSCSYVAGWSSERGLLESFFPFDPFLLRVSARFIDPLYCEFKDPDEKETEVEADDESLGMAGEEEDAEEEHKTGAIDIKRPEEPPSVEGTPMSLVRDSLPMAIKREFGLSPSESPSSSPSAAPVPTLRKQGPAPSAAAPTMPDPDDQNLDFSCD